MKTVFSPPTPMPPTLPARPAITQSVSWLAGMTPKQFMTRYWQKKPLLIRQAFPDFKPPITIDEVLRLSTSDAAQSRLVRRENSLNRRLADAWTLSHGPFRKLELPKLTDPNWTVLVQQVNTLLPAADKFMDAFRFIPEARLDDLMVSVAGPDGGIGAHTDSYDVFLLQAAGCRRWEISRQFSPEFQEDMPLKILKSFRAQEQWDLNPGDLLYLPPQVAHRGTAIGAGCMTWSIGFRAPSRIALADQAWAQHMDQLLDADWRDPWLGATDHPGEIPERLLSALAEQVLGSFPKADTLRRAIARALSEPAPSAIFIPIAPRPSMKAFVSQASRRGVALSPASRLLYADGLFFMNGEQLQAIQKTAGQRALQRLADHRQLSPAEFKRGSGDAEFVSLLHDMTAAGWIVYH